MAHHHEIEARAEVAGAESALLDAIVEAVTTPVGGVEARDLAGPRLRFQPRKEVPVSGPDLDDPTL
jgi:hypothetical protein